MEMEMLRRQKRDAEENPALLYSEYYWQDDIEIILETGCNWEIYTAYQYHASNYLSR